MKVVKQKKSKGDMRQASTNEGENCGGKKSNPKTQKGGENAPQLKQNVGGREEGGSRKDSENDSSRGPGSNYHKGERKSMKEKNIGGTCPGGKKPPKPRNIRGNGSEAGCHALGEFAQAHHAWKDKRGGRTEREGSSLRPQGRTVELTGPPLAGNWEKGGWGGLRKISDTKRESRYALEGKQAGKRSIKINSAVTTGTRKKHRKKNKQGQVKAEKSKKALKQQVRA